jgi:hypothetical protein
VRGVHNHAPRYLAAALDFLARRRADLPFEELISPPLPRERLDEGLQLARSRRWQRVAIRP